MVMQLWVFLAKALLEVCYNSIFTVSNLCQREHSSLKYFHHHLISKAWFAVWRSTLPNPPTSLDLQTWSQAARCLILLHCPWSSQRKFLHIRSILWMTASGIRSMDIQYKRMALWTALINVSCLARVSVFLFHPANFLSIFSSGNLKSPILNVEECNRIPSDR